MKVNINGFEDYQISPDGEVFSKERIRTYIWKNRTVTRTFKPSEISPHVDSRGYKMVNLYGEKGIKRMSLHRLLAIHFIPNPNNYSCVNHIDGNKTNNRLDNLEWCTQKHNVLHAWKSGLCKEESGMNNSSFKCPIQAEKIPSGEGLVMFGRKQMESAGFDSSNVYRCCRGKQKYHRGHKFSYMMKDDEK